jgi:predicted DNA-binding mobile mystery protein A
MKQHIDYRAHVHRQNIDSLIKQVKKELMKPPKIGWISAVRKAMQMTTTQLAKRLHVAQSVVSNYEKAERHKSITLRTLEKVADALNCDLHYVLVPRKAINDQLMERAEEILKREWMSLDHHMRLEGQEVDRTLRNTIEAACLIESKDKRLWEMD